MHAMVLRGTSCRAKQGVGEEACNARSEVPRGSREGAACGMLEGALSLLTQSGGSACMLARVKRPPRRANRRLLVLCTICTRHASPCLCLAMPSGGCACIWRTVPDLIVGISYLYGGHMIDTLDTQTCMCGGGLFLVDDNITM